MSVVKQIAEIEDQLAEIKTLLLEIKESVNPKLPQPIFRGEKVRINIPLSDFDDAEGVVVDFIDYNEHYIVQFNKKISGTTRASFILEELVKL